MIKCIRRHSSSNYLSYQRFVLGGVNQEGKKFCISHELGNKMLLGVWAQCEPLSEFNGEPGGKALEKFKIFS